MEPKKKAKTKTEKHIQRPTWSRMTLDEWKESESRRDYINELFHYPLFLEFIAMLYNESVKSRSALPMNQIAVNIEIGRIEGRLELLSWIENASEIQSNFETHIPVDYGVASEEELKM